MYWSNVEIRSEPQTRNIQNANKLSQAGLNRPTVVPARHATALFVFTTLNQICASILYDTPELEKRKI